MRFDHGGSPSSAIDASVNVNPLGAPVSLDSVFARARGLAQRYPEPDAGSARRAWAQRLGVPVERLLIGNGASELISLAVRALAPRRVIVFDPCYSEYEAAAAAAGCTVEHMALQRENGSWRTPRYLPATCKDDLVVVAQPNNPTGHFTPRDHLLSMAAGPGCPW
ncbi:MAG: aminotransferase class I/II-fold pyridoxal phosphate-dependent enzyme [Coriobacteriia bacterium]